MANFQTRILHLDLCVIIILLTYTENRPASPKQMPLYIITIISCFGVIMIFLIITICFYIHRSTVFIQFHEHDLSFSRHQFVSATHQMSI
ncbi:hypothetical protein DPX16_0557 [Anabarilius grahami]|uniref:Uncharacterized protein n=1 Tax=Anabarilius grahami TaxID=495550 RepID=A0A3N0XW89_ANAGA|nr:hypothetical protein DPX16_0557 [Anabarilius grahami]